MDRFSWSTFALQNYEHKHLEQNATRLYDGDDKTSFDDGILRLTSHRMVWQDSSNQQCVVAVALDLVAHVEKVAGGFSRSPKLVVHLCEPPSDKPPGPMSRSRYSFVKISFKTHGLEQYHNALIHALQTRQWEKTPIIKQANQGQSSQRFVKATGIVGIERKIEEKRKETDNSISTAFQDMTKLMDKAKEMVSLSQTIATKIKDKQGDITEDETVKFKSYLLSLGIPNPVTKETHGSGTHYHMQLAKELCNLLLPVLQENGGILLLSDVYCRSNRARGMELLSPDDMLNACNVMAHMKLPMRLRIFDSGVSVLQLESHSDEVVIKQTTELVTDSECLSAQQLANIVDVSVLLAKERLLLAEKVGKLCRDDSVEGLKFYPNLFATRS